MFSKLSAIAFKRAQAAALFASLCSLSGAANALTFVSVSSNAATDFADLSFGPIYLESAHTTTTPVRFEFAVDVGDTSFQLDAITRWVGQASMPGVRIGLDSGAVFVSAPGSVQAINQPALTGSLFSTNLAGADFAGGTTESYFGDPLGLVQATWTIDVSNVSGTMGITVTPVPEPLSALLMALGLGVVAGRARAVASHA